MKVLNIGSLNIDEVYSVRHFVKPGETISSTDFNQFCGGKGLNQSIALANAGADVFHAGAIGKDGLFLRDRLDLAGVDTSLIKIKNISSGKAVIQVIPEGENCIILFKGANHSILEEDIVEIIAGFDKGDVLLLQNEINNIGKIITLATERGLKIAFNPAPMDDSVLALPLDKVDIFIVNEIEGKELTGEDEPEAIGKVFCDRFPDARLVLTLGERGVYYQEKYRIIQIPAKKIKPIDTTAAGDTFTGFFLAGFSRGDSIEACLKNAVKASAMACTRMGAADSIPLRLELD